MPRGREKQETKLEKKLGRLERVSQAMTGSLGFILSVMEDFILNVMEYHEISRRD